MPRSSGGTYSLPPTVNPVTTATTITSNWANTTLPDIATEITDSLSRSGEGAMLAPLRVPDGSAANPSVTFDSDQNTGIYRAGADDLRIAAGGSERLRVTTGGALVTGALTASGDIVSLTDLNVTGASFLGGAVTIDDSATVAGTLAVTGAVALNGGTSTNIALGVSNPISTTAFTNTLTPMSFAKAMARFTTAGGGVITLNDGFNVTGASIVANTTVRITLASPMAAAAGYIAALDANTGLPAAWILYRGTFNSTTEVDISACRITTAPAVNAVDFSATALICQVVVFGAQ